jgi:hypothetical protein
MTSELGEDLVPAAADPSSTPPRDPGVTRAGRLGPGLILVLVGQAAWVWVLCARGWFYQDDISSLDFATGRSLTWGYLTAPVNDHLVPGLRLVFWLQEHIAPLSYTSTVVIRVVLQSLAVYLLYRLLVLLCGARRGALVLTALYAFNPLIVCNLTWLTTAAGLVPAQLSAVLAVHHHVRYTVTGRLRDAAYTGLALLLGMCFWEKTAIVALMLPLISAGYLATGPARSRVRQIAGRWRGWLLTGVPPLLFVGYFVARHYGGHAHSIGAGPVLGVTGRTWWETIAPALLDGPWSWSGTPGVFVSFTASPLWIRVVAQLLVALLVVAGWRRTGARSLWAWSLPLISVVFGSTLVAVGRYQFYGDLLALTIRYSFDVAFALVLGVALALLPSSAPAIAARATGSSTAEEPNAAALARSWYPAVAVFTVLAMLDAGISALRFEHRWVQDPTRGYVAAVEHSLRTAGPTANVYDSSIPPRIMPTFGGASTPVSRLAAWAGTPVHFDRAGTPSEIVDDHGHLKPATLLQVAHATTTGPNPFCNDLVAGVGTRTQLLVGSPQANEWYFHLEYFQQRPTTLYVRLRDARGATIVPIGGARIALPAKLGAVDLRLPYSAPREVRLRSDNAATNVCLTQVVIGSPIPNKGTR